MAIYRFTFTAIKTKLIATSSRVKSDDEEEKLSDVEIKKILISLFKYFNHDDFYRINQFEYLVNYNKNELLRDKIYNNYCELKEEYKNNGFLFEIDFFISEIFPYHTSVYMKEISDCIDLLQWVTRHDSHFKLFANDRVNKVHTC